MKVLIYTITSLLILGVAGSTKAQVAATEKVQHPILKNLLHQDSLRMIHPRNLGIGIGSFTAGYALMPRLTVTATVHPRNNFKEGDAIGLGFGSGTGGSNWKAANVYGQTGLAGYENMDAASVLLGGRYFVFSSIFVSAGMVAQVGSWRQVDFASDTRTINESTYGDLGLTVHTNLKNQYVPYFGVGFHHQVGRFGLFLDVAFSGFSKKLDSSEITTTQTLSEADFQHFQDRVISGAESEGFGIMTYGFTIAF